MPIDGLKIPYTGRELIDHCNRRAQYHAAQAEFYRSIERAEKREQWRVQEQMADVLKFNEIASRIVASETYMLDPSKVSCFLELYEVELS